MLFSNDSSEFGPNEDVEEDDEDADEAEDEDDEPEDTYEPEPFANEPQSVLPFSPFNAELVLREFNNSNVKLAFGSSKLSKVLLKYHRKLIGVGGSASTRHGMITCSVRATPQIRVCPGLQTGATITNFCVIKQRNQNKNKQNKSVKMENRAMEGETQKNKKKEIKKIYRKKPTNQSKKNCQSEKKRKKEEKKNKVARKNLH